MVRDDGYTDGLGKAICGVITGVLGTVSMIGFFVSRVLLFDVSLRVILFTHGVVLSAVGLALGVASIRFYQLCRRKKNGPPPTPALSVGICGTVLGAIGLYISAGCTMGLFAELFFYGW